MKRHIRHQARIWVIQSLYEWDVTQHDPHEALEHLINGNHGTLGQEHVLLDDVEQAGIALFARNSLTGILEFLGKIDEKLAAATPQRPLAQMARVEKAILRLAIFEILFNNAVPARAAINEAIELAKTYGSENSGRFVNGVLGTIVNEASALQTQKATLESEELYMSASPHWEALQKAISQQLDVPANEVVPEASFKDNLHADSLDLVELIMSLEETFDIKIKDEDARAMLTVGDALNYIDSHVH